MGMTIVTTEFRDFFNSEVALGVPNLAFCCLLIPYRKTLTC